MAFTIEPDWPIWTLLITAIAGEDVINAAANTAEKERPRIKPA
jgi:hypothetical protein